ncbi:uncharacterized protein LOC6540910 [Drosophila erecta]|uniref:Uncharacterized protein n=1 Tax=Drosophila erecta TaxID=7220 RepID=B3N7M8_DROER|nr:uncharacterized protein LOC6540910 [Drosophila erecta]EDV57204.1 uncharacterized protein Dere_GG24707 [Drosophila erecta]
MNSTDTKKKESRIHKLRLESRTKNWGKNKFKPKKYVEPSPDLTPQGASTPWQLVKNHILTDSSGPGLQDMDSKDARQFMQQRQQNHRRNIIEANRSQATEWESFDDEKPSTEGKQKLRRSVENFTFRDRNYFRKKLTLGFNLTHKNSTLKTAIKELKYKQEQKESELERLKNIQTNMKSSNTNGSKGSNPFQKMRDNAHPYRKKGRNGKNPFQKGHPDK